MGKSIEWKLDRFLEAVKAGHIMAGIRTAEAETFVADKYFKDVYGDESYMNHRTTFYKSVDEYKQIIKKCEDNGFIGPHAVNSDRYTLTVEGMSFLGYQKTKIWNRTKHIANVVNIVLVLGAALAGVRIASKQLDNESTELERIKSQLDSLSIQAARTQFSTESFELRIERLEKSLSDSLR